MIRLGNFSVVLDACVLYDSLIRDLLLRIAEKELYKPIWSNFICEEVTNNLITKANVAPENAIKLIQIMCRSFPEAMSINESEILDLKNTDINKKDWHVVSTAICNNSQVIVTYNIKDFPKDTLKQFAIEPQTPDEFLMNILDLSYKQVLSIYADMENTYKNPPISREKLLNCLSVKVPNFAAAITPYLDGSITRLY